MIWRVRSRYRTICFSLAFGTVFLHLLLALVSLPISHQPCDPQRPPKTRILRNLAHVNSTSADWLSAPTELPNDAENRDFPSKGAKKGDKGHGQTLSDVFLSVKEDIMNTTAGVGRRHGTNRAESVESGLSKLEALFDHPLYNMPRPPIPEEDWLLKEKSKEASEKSSQMWSVF